MKFKDKVIAWYGKYSIGIKGDLAKRKIFKLDELVTCWKCVCYFFRDFYVISVGNFKWDNDDND